MKRTQINLTREQAVALDREAIEAALRASAGAWTDHREDGETYAERFRTGRRWGELDADGAQEAGGASSA